MGKVVYDADAVLDEEKTESGKKIYSADVSLDEEEPVKKKEPLNLPSSIDLRTGLPINISYSESISPSKFQSPLPSDKNPYNQIIKSGTNNAAKIAYQDSKSFLDNDIQMQYDMKLNNPALKGEQDKFSLNNAEGEPEKYSIQSVTPQLQQEVEKRSILNSPEALKEYRKKRLSEIDKRVTELEKAAVPYETADLLSDPLAKYQAATDAYKTSEQQVAADALKDYKKQLDESIANTAKVSIAKKHLDNTVPIDLKQIGNEYLRTIGDTQINDDNDVLDDIESGKANELANKKDIDLTRENIQYKMYKTGADVMTDYFSVASDDAYEIAKPKIETLSVLFNKQEQAQTKEEKDLYQRQINAYLSDPAVSNYLQTTRQSLDYYTKSEDAINQFPQVKRQQIRTQLNDVYMDMTWDKKEDSSSPFATGVSALNKLFQSIAGSTPDDKDLKAIAQATGLSEDIVKSVAQEKTEGFFGVSPSGVRVTGLLQGLAKGTDEQLAKSVMGVRRFFDTDNAETKNRLLQDKLNVYNTEGSVNKLKDDLGKWNINPFSIFNTMGRGVGQTAVFAAPTLVTGGLAAEGAITEKIIEAATTIGSGYAGSYEDAYKEASKYTDNEETRRQYANVTAFENALPELLLSPADIAKKISGVKKAVGKEAFEAFAKEGTEKGLQQAAKDRIVSAVKEFGNVVGAENIEEALTNVSNNITKEKMFGVEMSVNDWVNQAIETAVQTTITTLPLGVGAGINGTQDISGIRKEGLFEAGNEPDLYKERLKNLFDNGQLNQQQLNERTQVVNTMQNIVATVNKATKADGSPLSYDEKRDLAAQQYRIQQNEDIKKKGNPIAAQVQQIEDDTQDALATQNEIIFGTKKPLEEEAKPVEKVEAAKEEIKIPEPPKVKGEPEEITQPIELEVETSKGAGETKPEQLIDKPAPDLHPEIKKLEEEKNEKIIQASKPDISLPFIEDSKILNQVYKKGQVVKSTSGKERVVDITVGVEQAQIKKKQAVLDRILKECL